MDKKAAEARQEELAQQIRDYQHSNPVVLTRTQCEDMDDTGGLLALRAGGFALEDAEVAA